MALIVSTWVVKQQNYQMSGELMGVNEINWEITDGILGYVGHSTIQ